MSDLDIKVKQVEDNVENAYASIEDVRTYLRDLEDRLMEAFLQAAKTFSATVDEDDLKLFIQEFIKKPYFVLPRRENEWWLVVPRFITLEFGFLVAQEGAWNIFIVNKYVAMIQQVPEELREEIDLSTPFNGITIEDGLLHIEAPDRDDVRDVHARYKKYLGKIQDTATITIKKGMLFEAMAALIRDGILPYKPRPIPKSLLHSPATVEKRRKILVLRDYQARDRDIILKMGAAGIFYPMGGGKSFIALDLIAMLKGEILILVPNASVAEQWLEYIDMYLDVDPNQVTVLIYHVANAKKVKGKKWSMVVYDEVATLPADTHLQFADLDADARVFMTATPIRGDRREDLIFALCRNPLGVNWKYFLEHGLVKFPTINVWVERDEAAKDQKLDELLDPEKKIMIFVDKLVDGRKIAKKYDIPFVSGKTKREERLQIMRENQWVVVSRIADFGISMKSLNMVIEADINWSCYDSQTEILTKEGWKYFQNLSEDDEVACLSEDGFIEYTQPTEIQKHYFDGKLIHFGGYGSRYDLMVTPNHRMYVEADYKPYQRIITAEHLASLSKNGRVHYRGKKDAKWRDIETEETFKLPSEYLRKYSPKSTRQATEFPIDSFLRFMGWYLSEGSTWGAGIQIAQSKIENRSEIAQTFADMGLRYKLSADAILCNSRPLVRYLKQFGTAKIKFIPRWIKELPPKKLRIILDALMKGDGHDGRQYHTASKRLADDVQEIAIKCELGTTMHTRTSIISGCFAKDFESTMHRIYTSKHRKRPRMNGRIEYVPYNGFVYDVSVPISPHVVLVRRNGKAIWSGNSQGQATQRAGRTFHSEEEGTYHGLMTAEKYLRLKDRYLLMWSRGLKVRVELADDLPVDLAAFVKRQRASRRDASPTKAKAAKGPKIPVAKVQPVDTSEYPVIDERREIDMALIKEILASEYSKKKGGLFVYEVRAILRFNHIAGADTRFVHDLIFRMYKNFKIGGRTEGNKRKHYPKDGFV